VRLRDRYGLALLLLLVAYVLTAVGGDVARALSAVTFGSMLVVALLSRGIPPVLRTIGIVTACTLVAVGVVLLLVGENDVTLGTFFLLVALLQALVVAGIVARVLQHGHVTSQTLMGAVTAYAVIAFVASSVYRAVDFLADEPFFGRAVDSGDYIYFSIVTLTTTGYGDFVPATDLGRHLVVVEALVGQIFLVTLVARLVALLGQPMARRRRGENDG
jgi:voltage-gated potassium channel Kch